MRDEECHPGGRGTLDLQARRETNCGSGEKIRNKKPKSRRREIQNVALVGCGKPIGLLKLLALAVLHFLAKKGMHSALLALWQVLYSVLVVTVSVCSLQLSGHIIVCIRVLELKFGQCSAFALLHQRVFQQLECSTDPPCRVLGLCP